MSITSITSPTHFSTILSSSTYVVVDFYADWCGPCKAIAPLFSQLATSEAKPGRMTFVKVDVDAQQSIARTNGVTAMPTFLIFKNGKVVNTIRGADPASLRSAILSASADAARSPARTSIPPNSKGHVLGSGPSSTKTSNTGLGAQFNNTAALMLNGGLLALLMRFFGLYFTTLLSLDPHAAAEGSTFNVRR